jgi:hypothetical protein
MGVVVSYGQKVSLPPKSIQCAAHAWDCCTTLLLVAARCCSPIQGRALNGGRCEVCRLLGLTAVLLAPQLCVQAVPICNLCMSILCEYTYSVLLS